MATQNKTAKIVFWITTALLALFIIPGAFFMNSEMAKQGIAHLEVPKWLAIEVGIGQPLAALLLIIPLVGKRLKEWAYVGLGIVYISAFIAHMHYDGFGRDAIMAIVLFLVLVTSYISYHKMTRVSRY